MNTPAIDIGISSLSVSTRWWIKTGMYNRLKPFVGNMTSHRRADFMERHTVLLLHANEPNWEAVRTVLRDMRNVELKGDVASAGAAIQCARDLQPDLILASSRLAGESSYRVLAELRTVHSPNSLIALFAMRFEGNELRQFGQLNLSGCCRWEELTDLASIKVAVNATLTGDLLVGTPSIAQDFFYLQRGISHAARASIRLTDGEWQVLRLLAAGRTREEICDQIERSARTLDRRIEALKDKLGAANRASLVFKAVQFNLIPWPDDDDSS